VITVPAMVNYEWLGPVIIRSADRRKDH